MAFFKIFDFTVLTFFRVEGKINVARILLGRIYMTRAEFESLVLDSFGVTGDNPFSAYDSTLVLRHPISRKWFGILMRIKKSKLGIMSDDYIDIVNLKCGNEIISSMLELDGVYPAYHMTKSHWVSVALDGSCDDEDVKFILNVSHELTKGKKDD
jgi:predicted DNA-binding protein (MmcQ/YjbR family)